MPNLYDSDLASWEDLARRDPLWAVLSSDEYHAQSLTAEAEDRFWRSGEEHVDHVTAIICGELDPDFSPGVSLDFGCGVGRNLVPLARRSKKAVGLDASATMVDRARARATELGLANVEVHEVGRRIDPVALQSAGPIDFVHSVLVFQHIVAVEGFALLDQLLELLAPGGFGFVQFQCRNPGSDLDRLVRSLRLRHPWFNRVALSSRIRLFSQVVMLYEYDMADLLSHLARHRIGDVVVERVEDGGGGYAARLYFRKDEEPLGGPREAGTMKVRMRP